MDVSTKIKYPATLTKDGGLQKCEGKSIAPGTLPEAAEISGAARDLLCKLLQPDPRLRLKSVRALQRISFFMGHDISSYTLKKTSPFVLLGRKLTIRPVDLSNFHDFDSFVGGSTNRKWDC